MAIGLAATVLNGGVDALCRAVNYTAPAAFWVKLHLADPGSASPGSPAANTTRVRATFNAAAGGSGATSGAVTWTSVPNAETYSHWTASTAGTSSVPTIWRHREPWRSATTSRSRRAR
jgi:hypothetical protein